MGVTIQFLKEILLLVRWVLSFDVILWHSIVMNFDGNKVYYHPKVENCITMYLGTF